MATDPNDPAELRKTARHEAAHAVAALHYDCGIEFATIEPKDWSLGTTRLGVSKVFHAIPLFCGPLAEREWPEFAATPPDYYPNVMLWGGDLDQFLYLASGFSGNLSLVAQVEAWWFLGQPEVQQQIDRVAAALLQCKRLTRDEIVEIARFSKRLCAEDWLR